MLGAWIIMPGKVEEADTKATSNSQVNMQPVKLRLISKVLTCGKYFCDIGSVQIWNYIKDGFL